jgi:hypothetical protein
MKYIRIQHIDDGHEMLLCGSGMFMRHDRLATLYRDLGYKVVSAGFFHFDQGGRVVVHGFSVGLNIGPLADDPEFITRLNQIDRMALPIPAAA